MSENQHVPDDQDLPVPDEQDDPAPGGTCEHCKQRPALEGYPTKLCAECRQHFIRFPIPVWIKLFAACILVIVIFASYSFPRQLTIGLHMAKGEEAEKSLHFLTAQKEFDKASHYLSNSLELNCHLFICAAHNGDSKEMNKYWTLIKNKDVDDDHLLSEVEQAVSIANTYFPSDELAGLNDEYPTGVPDTTLIRCMGLYPDDESIALAYADHLYIESRYDTCARVLSYILYRNESNVQALDFSAYTAVMRNLPDSALYFCDRLLRFNNENVTILSVKARNLLRLGRDQEAAATAEQAYKLNDTLPYTVGTMVLLYHYTKQPTQESQLLTKLRTFTDSTDRPTVQYVEDVLSGKASFKTNK